MPKNKDSKPQAKVSGAVGELIDPAKVGQLPAFSLAATTELSVSTDGIVDIIVSEFEDRVQKELNKGRRAVNLQTDVVADCRKELETAMKEAKEEACSKERSAAKAFYKAMGLECHCRTTYDVLDNDKIDIELQWYSSETGTPGQHSHKYVNPFELTRTLTPKELGVKNQFSKLRKAEAELQELKDLVQAWNRRKSEITQVERRTRAHLAKAALSRSEGGDALYDELMSKFNENFANVELQSFDRVD